nr:cral-trio domain-containing protein c3h8.02 [Quercus suber]
MKNVDLGPVRFLMTDQHLPETLGKVILYRASWFIAGFWRTIRHWLDPTVAYKINFAANISELDQHISRDRIPREFGGDEDYTWEYLESKAGENASMEQGEERDKIAAARADLIKSFESETASWLHPSSDGKNRDAVAEQLRRNYWELDPYIRARSVYDRLGMIQPGGEVNF